MNFRFVTKTVHAYLDYPVALSLMITPFLLGIGRSNQLYFTLLAIGNLAESERPIVDHIGVPGPMLFVIVAFGQQPELVATVVEPLATRWGQIFACVLGIDEKVWVASETELN